MRPTLSTLGLLAGLGLTLATLGCDELEGGDVDADVDAGADATDASSDAGAGRPEPTTDWDSREAFTPRFDFAGPGFYDAPWPSDARLLDDGTVDLSDFPNSDNLLIQDYRAVMERQIAGFSVVPVVYISYAETIEGVAMPEPPDTLSAEGAIQLIVAEPGRCAERVPVEVSPTLAGDRYTDPNTLRIATVHGFVLEPRTTYALVITRALGAEQGRTSAQPAALRALLDGTSTDAALSEVYAPLRDCMAEAQLWASEISVATVFTTHDPVEETRALFDVVNDTATPAPEVLAWAPNERYTTTTYTTYSGSVNMPIFQEGTPPYAAPPDGGGLVFGPDDRPVIQRWEPAPFSISWPRGAEAPVPVMVWIDGTGASATSHFGDPPFLQALARGFAVANVQPQFHAGRSGPGADEELHTFNYLNPASGRTVFRQQAAEVSYFLRMLRETSPSLEGLPALDPERIVYGGHSQGALVGAITAGIEDGFRGYFLNGVGAYLSVTIVERKDPFDIQQLVGTALDVRGPLDRFHPVVQLAQLGGDAVDPGSYARYWKGWEGNPGGNHLLMTNGDEDDTTHSTSIAALTIAGDAAPMSPPGWQVDPWLVWERDEEVPPIVGNREALDGSALTLVSYLRAGSGHFTIYDEPAVMEIGADFWRTAIDDEAPTAFAP